MEVVLFLSSIALFTGLNRGHMISSLKNNDRHLIVCDWPENGEGSTRLTQQLIEKLRQEEASGLQVIISGSTIETKANQEEVVIIVQPDNMIVTLTEDRLDAFVKFLHTKEFLSAVESQHPFKTKEATWDTLVLYFWSPDDSDTQAEAELDNLTDQEFDEQSVKIVQGYKISGDVLCNSFVVYPPGLWYEPCYERPLLSVASFVLHEAYVKLLKTIYAKKQGK